MTQEEIIQQVQKLLDLHLKRVSGYIGQEPYKGDFFKLFREAYHNHYFDVLSSPRLTGDAFRDVLVARWFDDNENLNTQRTNLMNLLFAMWDEWRYAWDNHG